MLIEAPASHTFRLLVYRDTHSHGTIATAAVPSTATNPAVTMASEPPQYFR